MPDSLLDECLRELETALASLEPEVTGLEGQRLLPNAEATQTALDAQVALFLTRKALLETAIGTLQGLQADGYPALPLYDVPPEVYAELQGNVEEVMASLNHFREIARLHVPQRVDVEVHAPEADAVSVSHSARSSA